MRALARAEERERLGIELHDGVVASLAGVACLLAAARRTSGASIGAVAALDRAVAEVARVVEEACAYASGLRARPDELAAGLLVL